MSSLHDSNLSIRLENLVNTVQNDVSLMSHVRWDSSEPLPEPAVGGPPPVAEPSAANSRQQRSTSQTGVVWLDGNVLMCACPDCDAPMSIRLWLMVADCWQCGTSIELSEELIREAEQLLKLQQSKEERPATAATPSQPASAPARPIPPAVAQPTPPRDNVDRGPSTRPGQRQRTSATTRLNREPGRLQRTVPSGVTAPSGVTVWLDGLFDQTPAWLVSLVFHLILLTLLGLLTLGESTEDIITLSTTVSKWVEEGGEVLPTDPLAEITYDLLPKNVDIDDPRQRAALLRAEQDAKQLRMDPDTVEPNLPEFERVKQLVSNASGRRSALAARDPRIRVEMLKREGGTTLTEAAVARGLRWLELHQERDGRWSLDRFNRAAGCTCTSRGIKSDSAATSLALLPFLGAGQTHLVGTYQNTVAQGLRWLLEQQDGSGDLRANSEGNAGMYAHGQGAIVLCEAYFMTGDERLRAPAQAAIDFIVAAQHSAGGWRYAPGMEGDTSVFGWQLMALQSARAANLQVPDETMELSGHYLDRVGYRGGSVYGYMPRKSPDEVMTAEALLCRAYLGWNTSTPGFLDGIDYLTGRYLPDPDRPNLYYWYYGTQLMHHVGGSQWETWNHRIRDILVETQRRRGHAAGSWNPIDSHDRAGGRLYATALATCTLEVYYRHLPIFRQIKLD